MMNELSGITGKAYAVSGDFVSRPVEYKAPRFDIQLLRGLSVLLIVAYHCGFGPKGGFLGVDIFFVISGFLITGIVVRELDAGTFSFRAFYTRRAKRLLPALYTTLALTTLASMWLLSSQDFIDFSKTVQGAVTFTGNLALLRQTGYFDGPSELKPLLHTWSLAIEEQFYLGIPLLLWLLPKRARLGALLLIAIASLGAWLAYRDNLPDDTFYRIEFRAWELAIGSLASFAISGNKLVSALFWPALAVTLGVPFYAQSPGNLTVAVCIATAIVLIRNHPGFGLPLIQRGLQPIAWMGNISYSWYLLHWPPMALMNAVYLDETPGWIGLAVALGSLLAATAMYYLIEQPVRHSRLRFTPARLATTLIVSSLLFAAPEAWRWVAQLDERVLARADNDGLASQCVLDGSGYAPVAGCDSAKDPTVLVWGDSKAMDIVAALSSVSSQGIRQATKLSCGPLLGMAPVNKLRLNRQWAEGCLRFNADVFASLEQNPNIKTVVLASSFERFVNPSLGDVLSSSPSGNTVTPASVAIGQQGLRNTVDAVRKLGRRVVIVAPPASAAFDVGVCLERRAYGNLTLGRYASCEITEADRREHQGDVLALMAAAAHWPDVKLADIAAPLCQSGVCRTSMDNQPLYIDKMHLTVEGGALLAAKYDWASWIGN